MKIERNRHPGGRFCNVIFGLCQITDGLIRTLSAGFLHSTAPLDWARLQAGKAILKRRTR